MLYLDNAATTLQKPPCVGAAVLKAMQGAGNASRGVNAASLTASRIVESARAEIATFFGFSLPHRVCFTQNATESLNTVIQGMFSPGDHVITTVMEHNSVLRPLYRMQKEKKLEVTWLCADENGRVLWHMLEPAIRKNTKALIVHHASNVTGNANDLYRLGTICRAHGLDLVVDAAQTAGVLPVDMEQMGIDVLCFTGHKGMLGPQGTGGILVGENVHIRPLKEGGSGIHSFDKRQPEVYPEHLEAGTLNVPGIAGLLAAVRYIREKGESDLAARELIAAQTFYRQVKNIPHVQLYGDYSCWDEGMRTGIVSLNLEGYSSAEVADELMERFGIATRSGAHCAPLAHKTLQTEKQGIVRFSFSSFSTEEEALQAAQAVETLACE